MHHLNFDRISPRLRATILMVLSATTVPIIGICIRYASKDLNNDMVVMLRNIVGLLFILPLIFVHRVEKVKTRRLQDHAIRGLLSAIAIALYFLTLSHMPLANATVLQFTAPIFLPLAAWPLLNEKPNLRDMLFLLIAFAGAWLISEPKHGGFGTMTTIGLLSAALSAITIAYGRRMTDTESPMTLMFYFALFTSLATMCWVMMFGTWQTPDIDSILVLGLAGLLGNMAQIWVISAYRDLPSIDFAALNYLSIPFTLALAWLIYNEVPGISSCAGIVLILAINFLVVRTSRPLTYSSSQAAQVPKQLG